MRLWGKPKIETHIDIALQMMEMLGDKALEEDTLPAIACIAMHSVNNPDIASLVAAIPGVKQQMWEHGGKTPAGECPEKLTQALQQGEKRLHAGLPLDAETRQHIIDEFCGHAAAHESHGWFRRKSATPHR